MSPPLETVVETALYAEDLPAMKAFYADVLGLQLIAEDPARHLFFQVGPASVLLIFRPSATQTSGDFPGHGTTGPGHVALGIAIDQFEPWRAHLQDHAVAIETELTWPRGGRSVYFRDPANNSVELITPGVWGTPAGW